MKRRVSGGFYTIRKESEKEEELDDVKPWKQGKERDSNRSCQSTVLTFPVEGKKKKKSSAHEEISPVPWGFHN